MKRIYIYYNKVCLLLVAVLMGTLMMSCERDNEVTPLPKETTEEKGETPAQGGKDSGCYSRYQQCYRSEIATGVSWLLLRR